ncbi:hypothetical protein Tco_0507579 [Tanacetum coccineum]
MVELRRRQLWMDSNAFSGTNGEDAVKHIDYFLKIVDSIKLLNVNYERIRLAIFPISLVGNASKWFDEFQGSITSWVDLTEIFFRKYYPPSRTGRITIKSNDQEGVADEEFSDAEEANNDDEQEMAEIFRIETNLFDYETPLCTEFKEFNFLLKVDPELFTHDSERTKTYEDYENELNDELEEPWSEDGVPYEIYDHIYEPFRFKNRKAKWPTCNSNEDGFCNEGEQDEEYVAIKECEYDDLTITNEDECRAYQEIFRSMDEGWMVFLYGDLAGKEIDKVGEVSIIWNPMCVVSCWNPDAFTTHILAHKLNLENLPKLLLNRLYLRIGVIMEYLVKISKKARIMELKRRHLKITVLTSYMPYPSRKIRHICACTSQETTKI